MRWCSSACVARSRHARAARMVSSSARSAGVSVRRATMRVRVQQRPGGPSEGEVGDDETAPHPRHACATTRGVAGSRSLTRGLPVLYPPAGRGRQRSTKQTRERFGQQKRSERRKSERKISREEGAGVGCPCQRETALESEAPTGAEGSRRRRGDGLVRRARSEERRVRSRTRSPPVFCNEDEEGSRAREGNSEGPLRDFARSQGGT